MSPVYDMGDNNEVRTTSTVLGTNGLVTQLNAADVDVRSFNAFDGSGAAVSLGESLARPDLYSVDVAGTVTDLGETTLSVFRQRFQHW